ncbi:MAG: TlpA disulfide reductase family protein [Polyangiales bacterium]
MRGLALLSLLVAGCLASPMTMEEVELDGDASATPGRELPPRWQTFYDDAGPIPLRDAGPAPRDVAAAPRDVVVWDAGVADAGPTAPATPPTPSTPPSAEPCGRYQGWTVWSCIDGRTRVRCINNALERDTCANRCVVQPVGSDDYCASASSIPDDACSWANTCGDCARQWSCGFCRSLGRCFLGTGFGPINRACAASDWVWDPNTCGGAAPTPTPTPTPTPSPSDACATSTSCETCTPRSGCGFCASTRRCQSGNSAGATTGDCPSGQWRWQTSECSGPAPVYDAGSPAPPPVVDAGPPAPPPSGSCVSAPPTGGFCTSPGSCSFQAPDTTSCESRAAYDFYGSEYCNARATVVVVGAGWCGACQQEAPQLEAEITRPYRARGLRVVTLLTENSDRSPATVDFALRWQSRFGLTSRMVVDPSRSITRRVRLNAYPFVVVVDRRGRLRMAEAAPRSSRIRSVVDTILSEP